MTVEFQGADPAPEGPKLNATVSQLHVALAKKNAEVEKLRSSLSTIQASSHKPPWQETRHSHDSDTVDKAQQCVSNIVRVHCALNVAAAEPCFDASKGALAIGQWNHIVRFC